MTEEKPLKSECSAGTMNSTAEQITAARCGGSPPRKAALFASLGGVRELLYKR